MAKPSSVLTGGCFISQQESVIQNNMYNPKHIQFTGKHDYDKESAEKYASWGGKSFSVNIFQWELKSNGKEMKRGKCKVRIHGNYADMEKVWVISESVVKALDENNWDGRKSITVK